MKEELQGEIKKNREETIDKLQESISEETAKTLKLVEDHMKVDPLTPERIELIKFEIKSELEAEFASRFAMLHRQPTRRKSSFINKDSIAELDPS